MIFLGLICCSLIGLSVYFLITGFLDIPTSKSSKVMLLTRKQQGLKPMKFFEVCVISISERIGKLIKIDKLRRDKLVSVLNISEVNMTPETYISKAFVIAGATALLAIPMLFIIPLFSFVVVGLAVTLWFSSYFSAFDYVKKRKKIIEREVPRFATTIAQSLENDRDVLKILMTYRRIAGKEFRKELDITIADMKTSNYENALLRLESRVGSTLLSDVIRGLIGVLRGDNQQLYFKMICFDMRQIEQSNLKKEAEKRPRQMQKYSMFMLICILIIYGVVLSLEVINSLGVFFS